ncbi:MAG: 6-phosphogluconolactonase [Egibacteraceae bacterium]
MDVQICPDPGSLALGGADWFEKRILQACAARGHAVLALSGGTTPAPMLAELARRDLPWDLVEVTQVDERVAPDGDPDRNWTMIQRELVTPSGLSSDHAHPMPVTDHDLKAAAVRYAAMLRDLCGGEPAVLDAVHLGLGADGHVASLVPGDPAVDERQLDVTLSGPYQGRVRMTLTFPVINRARSILWQVVGEEKAGALRDLLDGADIPARHIRTDGDVLILTDEDAAGRRCGPTGAGP